MFYLFHLERLGRKISESMFDSIIKFNKLESLDLSYNRINIDELYKLTKLNHLKQLYLRR